MPRALLALRRSSATSLDSSAGGSPTAPSRSVGPYAGAGRGNRLNDLARPADAAGRGRWPRYRMRPPPPEGIFRLPQVSSRAARVPAYARAAPRRPGTTSRPTATPHQGAAAPPPLPPAPPPPTSRCARAQSTPPASPLSPDGSHCGLPSLPQLVLPYIHIIAPCADRFAPFVAASANADILLFYFGWERTTVGSAHRRRSAERNQRRPGHAAAPCAVYRRGALGRGACAPGH